MGAPGKTCHQWCAGLVEAEHGHEAGTGLARN